MFDITSHQGNTDKSTMKYHFTSVRMAIIKKATNNKCWRGCGDKGTLVHSGWKCKLAHPVWRFLKKIKTITTVQSIPEYLSEENKHANVKRYLYPNVHNVQCYLL